MKKFRIKYAVAVLVMVSLIFVFEMPGARANTFYETFISSCESEEWFISFINSKFIENGKRFSDLTSEDDPTLLKITELEFPASGINKIPTAVKYLKNLTYVDLSYNKIADISPLYDCTKISVLNIDGNDVSSFSTAAFGSLTQLSASYNRLSSMPDLSANRELNTLLLSGNNINELSSLEGLSGLGYIDLSGNMISSADELGAFTMTSYDGMPAVFDISYNRLSDLSFTSRISGLKTLDVSYNFITENISSIPSSVVTLNISNNGLSDTNVFSSLTSLVYLDVSGNSFSKIGGIQKCTSLKTLNASSNKISDTTGLDYLINLVSLNLSDNLLNDMPLHTLLKKLSIFDISYNNISNVALVSRYTALTHFYASNNNISDFSAISGMRKLVLADFSNNNITTAYEKLYQTTPSLKVLKLSGNNLSKEELANLFANGYSEIWLCDMDLTDKIPDMSVYGDIYELYINNSSVSETDIDNLLMKTDYTGLGLGGIITADIIDKLLIQHDLVTLDVSGTNGIEALLADIARLNILILNMSGCNADEMEPLLLEGTIRKIDISDNSLKTVPADILRKAVSNGIEIDFSDNALSNDNVFYSYLKDFNIDFDGNYLDFNFGAELCLSNDTEKYALGDVLDLLSMLELNSIYSDDNITLPGATYFDVELINDDSGAVSVDAENLTLTINGSISVLGKVTVKISLLNTKREYLSVQMDIYTDELPFEYAVMNETDAIYGIEIGTTFAELFDEFALNENFIFKAFDAEGNELPQENLAATGNRIQIIYDENVVFEKTVIIFGDCSGDGKVNSIDLLIVKRHIFRQATLEGIYFTAADAYEDGKVNSIDLLCIKRYIFRQDIISQTRQNS